MNNQLKCIIKTMLIHINNQSIDSGMMDDLCDAIFDQSRNECGGIDCMLCLFGYRNEQRYPKDIIHVWNSV